MYLIKKIFLFILFYAATPSLYAQAGNDSCYKSFLKTYAAAGGYLEFKDVCRTSDGGYVLSGYNGPITSPIIIKLNKRAEVEWNKLFADPTWANKVLQTDDGNFLVSTFTPSKSQLTKFSNSGNVLWSKEFANLNGYNLHLYDIQKVNDGGFVMIFNSAWGSGPMYNYVVRVDSVANIIWKKEMLHSPNEPMVKSVLVDNNAIFIAADFYNGSYKQKMNVARLDLATGNFVWKKTFESDQPKFFDPHLVKINDTLCISAVTARGTTTAILSVSLLNVDANSGNKLSSFELNNLPVSYNVIYYSIYDVGPFQFNKTNDNNLFVAQQMTQNNSDVLNVTKFTAGGNIIWSKNYINYTKHDVWNVKSDNDDLLITGRRYVTIPNTTDVGFFMRLSANGNVVEQTLPPTADCYNEPATAASTQPLTINESATSNYLSTSTFNLLTESNFVPQLSTAVITVNEACHTSDLTCNALAVSGPASVCFDNSPVTYVATRNQGCTNPVNWFYDTAFVLVQQVTDTSITIRFRKTGYTTIAAKLYNSCSVTAINNTVKIYRNANSLNLGPNQAACFPATIALNAHRGFLDYLWNNGSTDSIISVSLPGDYYVDVTDSCGNIFSDTVSVANIPALVIDLGADRQKCNNDTLHLQVNAGFVNYQWGPSYNISNPQLNKAIINPQIDTAYYVRVEAANGCLGYDTVRIYVSQSPQINLGADTNFCIGDSVLLNAGIGFMRYQWNTGSVAQQIHVNSVGQYSVMGETAAGCKSFDTLKVLNNWPKPIVSLNNQAELCQGSSLLLDGGNFASYLWNTGAITKTITINNTGLYFLQVTDSKGCLGTDSIFIIPKQCSKDFYMPNAFTPNNDNRHDLLKPILVGNVVKYQFWIYNRYGQLVFNTKDLSKSWDGKYKQLEQAGSVFTWICRYQFQGGMEMNEAGTFILIR